MKITKTGFIFKPEQEIKWWKSHSMAPSAILLNQDTVRVYMGGWDENKISRIGYIDVDCNNPKYIKNVSQIPVLDIGEDGCFDENGVFPAHTLKEDDRVILFYTGFQLGHKIRHYNFGGAAVSHDNGYTFKRVSKAPILDRSDEGLFVRAGQSAISEKGLYHNVYSSGSSWHFVAGEQRPVYEIFYQATKDPFNLFKIGKKIISNSSEEHGLGRPQIIKLGENFYIFYTRRIIKDMRYHLGAAQSKDLKTWTRIDSKFSEAIPHGDDGEFDSQMVYFPCVVRLTAEKALLFYSGNYFGEGGIGCAILENF